MKSHHFEAQSIIETKNLESIQKFTVTQTLF
jgi:hypothetical protein